ncbi:piRNA biogenesis protein EXD1-like [Lingula anatina]|uniref:PiRNA biogenesis protein EXD1-like n=1 Tax=Lingula anatina TaxID=7574 RepID=A0A1S3JEH5_LINAN|nr:piRNA biogenesis protein EXD1-like [Lingula anatina]|eukprot:XP_013408812.1 piRNA biogenesis protein EXD1-like [Lingula anatina]
MAEIKHSEITKEAPRTPNVEVKGSALGDTKSSVAESVKKENALVSMEEEDGAKPCTLVDTTASLQSASGTLRGMGTKDPNLAVDGKGSVSEPYTLVDTKEGLETALKTLKSVSKEGPNLAVDGEGVDYSRRGTLSLLAVATRDHVFLFDMIKLGQLVFDRGLREILEDPTREKLMFDCREDSDILWHNHHVKLDGVLDIQILQVMYSNRDNSDLSPFGQKRCAIAPCEKVFSLLHCLVHYTDVVTSIKINKSVGSFFFLSTKKWMDRPLPADMIKYACVEVSTLFGLYEKMKMSNEDMRRLKTASSRYADLKRSLTVRRFDEFEKNGYLPLHIIPPKGSVGFSDYQSNKGTECTGCKRRFPREAFTYTQLRKGEQKCRVCRKVKNDNDVESNREDNWARDCSDDSAVYYSTDENEDYY